MYSLLMSSRMFSNIKLQMEISIMSQGDINEACFTVCGNILYDDLAEILFHDGWRKQKKQHTVIMSQRKNPGSSASFLRTSTSTHIPGIDVIRVETGVL